MFFKNKTGKIRSFEISSFILITIIVLIISSIITTLFSVYLFSQLYYKDHQIFSQLPFFGNKEEQAVNAAKENTTPQLEAKKPDEIPPPALLNEPKKPVETPNTDETKNTIKNSILKIENLRVEPIEGGSGSNLFFDIAKTDNKDNKIPGVTIVVLKVNGNFISLPQDITLINGVPKWNKKGFPFNFRYRKQVIINLPKQAGVISEISIYIFNNRGHLLLDYHKTDI